MISEKAMDFVVSLVETSGKSYDTIADACGISKSTISRLVKNRQATLYTIDLIIAYFERGEDWREIVGDDRKHTCHLVADIRNELKHIEDIYAEREQRIQQQCDERVESLRAQMQIIQDHNSTALQNRDNTYDKSIAYLKTDIERLRAENKYLRGENARLTEANIKLENASDEVAAQEKKRADSVLNKRQTVLWVFAAMNLMLSIALIVSLFLDSPFS